MRKKLNNLLTATVCVFVSSFVSAEVYKCDVDGKMVFQQIPCPVVEVVSTGCDENYDYSQVVGEVDATFDVRYCYYMQLDNVDDKEKQRILQAYIQKRTAIRELAEREKAYDELEKLAGKSNDYMPATESYAKESSDYIEELSSYGQAVNQYAKEP